MGVDPPAFQELGASVPKLGNMAAKNSQKYINRQRDKQMVQGTFKHNYYDKMDEP